MKIIPAGKTFGSELGKALGGGLGSGFTKAVERRELEKDREKSFQQQMELQKLKNQKSFKDQLIDEESYDKIKNAFGQKFADLYQSSPQGGRTELLKAGLEAKSRNLDLEQLLGGIQETKENISPEDVGLTPKERAQQKIEKEKFGRQQEAEIAKPVMLEMNEIRKNIPLQEQAIQDIIEASPNVNSLDYFADVTGFEPLRSASGAKFKTAVKDFFLSDLSRAGARPNQWIEQQLADALPKIGRNPEANLITAEGMKFKVDLAKKRVEIHDRLVQEDQEKHGYVKGDIDSRTAKEVQKYAIDRQKILKDSIENIKTLNKPVKKGTKLPLDTAKFLLKQFNGDREKAEKKAKELGYEF